MLDNHCLVMYNILYITEVHNEQHYLYRSPQ